MEFVPLCEVTSTAFYLSSYKRTLKCTIKTTLIQTINFWPPHDIPRDFWRGKGGVSSSKNCIKGWGLSFSFTENLDLITFFGAQGRGGHPGCALHLQLFHIRVLHSHQNLCTPTRKSQKMIIWPLLWLNFSIFGIFQTCHFYGWFMQILLHFRHEIYFKKSQKVSISFLSQLNPLKRNRQLRSCGVCTSLWSHLYSILFK